MAVREDGAARRRDVADVIMDASEVNLRGAHPQADASRFDDFQYCHLAQILVGNHMPTKNSLKKNKFGREPPINRPSEKVWLRLRIQK